MTTMKYQNKMPLLHLHKSHHVLVTAIVAIVITFTTDTVSSSLAVDPTRLTTEVGDEAVFTCSGGENETSITWTHSGNNITITDVSLSPQQPHQQRVTSEKGKLTIRNVTESDQGKYTCGAKSPKGDETQDADLVVYVMPDYQTELLAVAGVSLFLLIVLSVLVAVKWRMGKKERDMQEHKNGSDLEEETREEKCLEMEL